MTNLTVENVKEMLVNETVFSLSMMCNKEVENFVVMVILQNILSEIESFESAEFIDEVVENLENSRISNILYMFY